MGSRDHQHLIDHFVAHAIHRVLIVDDDSDVVSATSMLLSLWGCESASVVDASRAEAAALTFRPDVILLDVAMSWINGFELCRAMKANANYSGIPVVFISGRSAPSDIETGMSCGAADYFVKPIDTQRLLERLRELSPE